MERTQSARRTERDQRKTRQDAMRDRIRKRAEEREKQGGGGTKYNLPSDVNFFQIKRRFAMDIIPYVVSVDDHPEGVSKGDYWYQRTVWVHYSVGAEEKSYICLKTAKKRCPICEHRAELMKQDKPDEELLKALKPREREIFNVYDQEDPDKGVQLWDVSYHLFGKHLEEEIREGKPEYAGFSEPEGGFTLKVRATEENMGGNKFMEASRIDFEEREPLDEKILAKALDLDKILKVLSYDELDRIFLELEEPTDKQDAKEEEESSRQQETKQRRGESTGDREADSADKARRMEANSTTVDRKPFKELLPKEEPKEQRQQSARIKAKNNGLECPAGGTFGKDCDELDACRTCEIWEKCLEAQEAGK